MISAVNNIIFEQNTYYITEYYNGKKLEMSVSYFKRII